MEYYLQNYSSIVLFQNTEYSIKIVGADEFTRANPVIVGEDVEDDISYNWYIIAHDNNSQYISIDLTKDRLGYCYDSFWDRHGLVGEQPIIAKSFTELLKRLYNSKGKSWYWTESDFSFYGDAYDN
ncbi:SMI1/KNR4 family protein [Myroides sp. LJL115]